MGVALALQVGVNYANDYSDGVRGTDLDRRGPTRLTASRLASPSAVRNAAFTCFGIAALLGLWLVVLTGSWWLLGIGALAILAAWFYTGGKKPYGYSGFGEVGVFCFFGLAATLGTAYTQLGRLNVGSWLGAIGVGLLACAILMINNIRDIPTDRLAGKRTLAVRLGDHRARICYLAFLLGALVAGLAAALLVTPWAWALVLLIGPAVLLTIPVRWGATGPALVPVLAGTSALELAYAIILSLAFIIGAPSYPMPSQPGVTLADQTLQFALYHPRSPDARYSTAIFGAIKRADNCLLVRDSWGNLWIPIFPVQIAAAQNLRVDDVVRLPGSRADGDFHFSQVTQAEAIANYRVNMPADCPTDLPLWRVTTTADNRLITGAAASVTGGAITYAWWHPADFDPTSTRRAGLGEDTLSGEYALVNNCVVITDISYLPGDVLPIFSPRQDSNWQFPIGEPAYLYGLLAVIDGDYVKWISVDPHRGDNAISQPRDIIGEVAGLNIPESCPLTEYLWITS